MRYSTLNIWHKSPRQSSILLTVLAIATQHFPKVIAEKESRLFFSICRWGTFHINGHISAFVGSGEAMIPFLPFDCIRTYHSTELLASLLYIIDPCLITQLEIATFSLCDSCVLNLVIEHGCVPRESCLGEDGGTIHLDCISLPEFPLRSPS